MLRRNDGKGEWGKGSPGGRGKQIVADKTIFYLLSPADGGRQYKQEALFILAMLKNRVRALPARVRPLASRAKKFFLLWHWQPAGCTRGLRPHSQKRPKNRAKQP